MMKPITGQYECVHSSGIGLDYFTSRVDRLILQANGHFSLSIQSKSRAANAAQSLVSGQQVTNAAPEMRREGSYTLQNALVILTFDDGAQEQGQIVDNGERLQVGPNLFSKVSDSTLLPPTHRMQKDMDDIAKGLKIASTIGGFALKAAKGIQSTIQSTQSSGPVPDPAQGVPSQQPYQGAPQQPYQGAPQPPYQGVPSQPSYQGAPQAPSYQGGSPQPAPNQPSYQGGPSQQPPAPPQAAPVPPMGAIFCDQCGNRCRPGKRFCGNCGAQLY
ncbi:MAG TPA: hypothetical protein VGN34_22810 [Ktedonobacteraceae bacterium]